MGLTTCMDKEIRIVRNWAPHSGVMLGSLYDLMAPNHLGSEWNYSKYVPVRSDYGSMQPATRLPQIYAGHFWVCFSSMPAYMWRSIKMLNLRQILWSFTMSAFCGGNEHRGLCTLIPISFWYSWTIDCVWTLGLSLHCHTWGSVENRESTFSRRIWREIREYHGITGNIVTHLWHIYRVWLPEFLLQHLKSAGVK